MHVCILVWITPFQFCYSLQYVFLAIIFCTIFIVCLYRYLIEQGLQPEAFTASVFKEMGQLDDTKPGPVARSLLPLLQVSSPAPPPRPNIAVSCLSVELGNNRSLSCCRACLEKLTVIHLVKFPAFVES
jgi:hypothetical protein